MNKKRFLTAVSLTLASSLILTACSAPIHISKTPAADVSADDEIEDDGIIWDEYEESPDAAEADGGYEEGGYEEEGYKEDAYDSGESEETSLKGILYLNRDMRFEENSYSPNDTIYYIGSADIYSLDPETGNSTLVRSFHIEELDNSMFGLTPWVLQNMGFDKNYERMVMDLDNNDGSHHVGWTDQDGNYTDVTAMITADAGDFGGVPYQFGGHFGPDNYFYFYEKGNIPYRVPIDNMNPESVEAVDHLMQLYPDGSVFVSEKPGFTSGTYYTDVSMSEEMPEHSVTTAWLGNGDYVKVDSGGNSNTTLWRKNSDGSEKNLLPDIPERVSYNPVVSPDGSQIAFLSSLRTRGRDVDNHAYIFSVSSEGGSPVKLADSPRFLFGGTSDIHLLEWR